MRLLRGMRSVRWRPTRSGTHNPRLRMRRVASSIPFASGDTIPARNESMESAPDMIGDSTSTTARAVHATLPRFMRAVVLTGHGGLDRLSFRKNVPVCRPPRTRSS